MAEAEQTSNPFRLAVLALRIRDSLEAALALEPDNLEVRLDLVRFHVMAPAIVGGDDGEAVRQAAEIARRNAPLGHFARGYIYYRNKEFGAARHEFEAARETEARGPARLLATRWLGWLSQESRQWKTAFAMFGELESSDGLYEIGRTAVFCGCELERGRAALEAYIARPRTAGTPSLAAARMQLGLLHERLGNHEAARRELDAAWRLDPQLEGLRQARRRAGR